MNRFIVSVFILFGAAVSTCSSAWAAAEGGGSCDYSYDVGTACGEEHHNDGGKNCDDKCHEAKCNDACKEECKTFGDMCDPKWKPGDIESCQGGAAWCCKRDQGRPMPGCVIPSSLK